MTKPRYQTKHTNACIISVQKHFLRVYIASAKNDHVSRLQNFDFSSSSFAGNPCLSSSFSTILVPLWFNIISLVFFYLRKLIFTGFLYFKGYFVCGWKNSLKTLMWKVQYRKNQKSTWNAILYDSSRPSMASLALETTVPSLSSASRLDESSSRTVAKLPYGANSNTKHRGYKDTARSRTTQGWFKRHKTATWTNKQTKKKQINQKRNI